MVALRVSPIHRDTLIPTAAPCPGSALERLLDTCAALARQGAAPDPATARLAGEIYDANAARLRDLAEMAQIETAGRP